MALSSPAPSPPRHGRRRSSCPRRPSPRAPPQPGSLGAWASWASSKRRVRARGPAPPARRFFLPSAPFGRPAFAKPAALALGRVRVLQSLRLGGFRSLRGAASAAAAREARFFWSPRDSPSRGSLSSRLCLVRRGRGVSIGGRRPRGRSLRAVRASARRGLPAEHPGRRRRSRPRAFEAPLPFAVRRSRPRPREPLLRPPAALPDRSDRSESSDASPPPWPSLSSSSPPSPGTDPPSCSNESESYAAGARSSTFRVRGSETDSEPETSLSLPRRSRRSRRSRLHRRRRTKTSRPSRSSHPTHPTRERRKPRGNRAPREPARARRRPGFSQRAPVAAPASASTRSPPSSSPSSARGSGPTCATRAGASTSAPAPDPSQYALGGRRWRPKLLRPATTPPPAPPPPPSPSPESSPL